MSKTTTAAEEKTTTAATEQSEKKHRYFASYVGMSGDKPYAFHLEGALTRRPNLLPAKKDADGNDLPPMAIVSMGVGQDCEVLYARAKHETAPQKEEPSPFVSLFFRDKLATKIMSEEMKEKGQLICVCGQMHTRMDTKTNRTIVEVYVSNYALMKQGASRNKRATVANNTFTAKDGVVRSMRMNTLMTGKITTEPELNTSAKGIEYLKTSMALSIPVRKAMDLCKTGKLDANGYQEDETPFVTLTFFGDDAVRKSKFMHKGMTVAVTGNLSENEYNGRIYYNLIPRCMSVLDFGQRPNDNNGSASASNTTASTPAAQPAAVTAYSGSESDGFAEIGDEEDFDLPF